MRIPTKTNFRAGNATIVDKKKDVIHIWSGQIDGQNTIPGDREPKKNQPSLGSFLSGACIYSTVRNFDRYVGKNVHGSIFES